MLNASSLPVLRAGKLKSLKLAQIRQRQLLDALGEVRLAVAALGSEPTAGVVHHVHHFLGKQLALQRLRHVCAPVLQRT